MNAAKCKIERFESVNDGFDVLWAVRIQFFFSAEFAWSQVNNNYEIVIY